MKITEKKGKEGLRIRLKKVLFSKTADFVWQLFSCSKNKISNKVGSLLTCKEIFVKFSFLVTFRWLLFVINLREIREELDRDFRIT